jgi:hypothetical protein
VLIRQILGAVSQFEKASLVAKLAGTQLRKRQTTVQCEGPKQAPEAAFLLPTIVAQTAKRCLSFAVDRRDRRSSGGGYKWPTHPNWCLI